MTELTVAPSCDDPVERGALPVDQAMARLLDAVNPILDLETVALDQAVDRILAEDLLSPVQVPSHRNAAVDGYAMRGQDLPAAGELKSLPIIGEASAGHPFSGALKPGQSVRIMTGAAMPDGADTVLMQEHVECSGQQVTLDARHSPGQNVRQAGEDIQINDRILSAGARLTPPQVGLISSLGLERVAVYRKLRVAVFSTGDELLAGGEPAREGFIYDSNRFSLTSALQRLGCDVLNLGIVPDNKAALSQTLAQASKQADVIFSSGGVSVGEADFTRTVLSELGEIGFWKIAMKPGRPIAFGRIGEALFFGLPGNPVAVLVTFYQFAKPALEKMMGLTEPLLAPRFKARSAVAMRKRPGRTEYQRGILYQSDSGEWQVKTTGKQGSGILRSMCLANCFVILPHESGSVAPGDDVLVQPFAGLF